MKNKKGGTIAGAARVLTCDWVQTTSGRPAAAFGCQLAFSGWLTVITPRCSRKASNQSRKMIGIFTYNQRTNAWTQNTGMTERSFFYSAESLLNALSPQRTPLRLAVMTERGKDAHIQLTKLTPNECLMKGYYRQHRYRATICNPPYPSFSLRDVPDVRLCDSGLLGVFGDPPGRFWVTVLNPQAS